MKYYISSYIFILLSFCATAQVSNTPITLSPFKNGHAKIISENESYYITTTGKKIQYIPEKHISIVSDEESVKKYENELIKYPGYLPATVTIFTGDNGLQGVRSPKGEIIVPASYENIETSSRQFWKLFQNGKVSLFLADKTILPFFDDIGYLNGDYFDVKQNGKWSLYSKSRKKIVSQNLYDGFDYCSGCGIKSNYVYARKGDKWGIIDWNEKILIPFEYNHIHSGMRSDNWIQTFSKNDEYLIIHLVSKQIFDLRKGRIISGMLAYQKDNKFALYNQQGELVLPFEYDNITEPNENSYQGYYGPYLLVKKDKKEGIVNLDGKIVLPAEYDKVMVYENYFAATKNEITYLINHENKILTQVEHGSISHINNYFYSSGNKGVNVFKIKKKAYYGLYFPETGVYHEPVFYEADITQNDTPDSAIYVVGNKQGIVTVFDLEGKLLLPPKYNSFHKDTALSAAFMMVVRGQKAGIFNIQEQREIIPPVYDKIETIQYKNDRVFIVKGGGYENSFIELFSTDGKKILDKQIMDMQELKNGIYLLLFKDEKTGKNIYALLDVDSGQLAELNYPYVYTSGSDQLLLVSKDNQTAGLYNILTRKTGKELYDITYKSGQYGKLSKYPSIYTFKKGVAKIQTEAGFGFIDETGKELLKPVYPVAEDFAGNDIIVFGEAGKEYGSGIYKVGFMNFAGKIIFPPGNYTFHQSAFLEDFCLQTTVILPKMDVYPELFGLGDMKTGKILLEPKYQHIRPLSNGKYLLLQSGKKFGIADLQGRIIVPLEYDDLYLPSKYDSGDDPLFPLPVKKANQWRYRLENGKYLEIVGSAMSLY